MNYPRLAWAQRVHEEFLKRQLSNPDLPKELIEDPADPWRVLQEGHFPTLVDLLNHGEDYKKLIGTTTSMRKTRRSNS